MKLLSIAVPCYNSAAYMKNCINSLLVGGDDVEIIIVDDGSAKDDTARIADEFMADYPGIVKAIHQENGGHGEAVNTGLKNATGLFFKVVDSDDWVNKKAYEKILSTLGEFVNEGKNLDMLLSDFVYEKQGATHKKTMSYKGAVPVEKMTSWDADIKFGKTQYILMHSVIYRTEMLRACNLSLPKHTFYVDNIFVFNPLPFVKDIYYLPVPFYRYFVGRDDQSVNEKVMISRIDQQIRVTKIMIESYLAADIKSDKLRNYMLHYLDMMMCICSILLIREGSKEGLEKKQALWDYLKFRNEDLYKKLRHSVFGVTMNLPGKGGRAVSVFGYTVARKLFGFN